MNIEESKQIFIQFKAGKFLHVQFLSKFQMRLTGKVPTINRRPKFILSNKAFFPPSVITCNANLCIFEVQYMILVKIINHFTIKYFFHLIIHVPMEVVKEKFSVLQFVYKQFYM